MVDYLRIIRGDETSAMQATAALLPAIQVADKETLIPALSPTHAGAEREIRPELLGIQAQQLRSQVDEFLGNIRAADLSV
jgi:hypothetical protein